MLASVCLLQLKLKFAGYMVPLWGESKITGSGFSGALSSRIPRLMVFFIILFFLLLAFKYKG